MSVFTLEQYDLGEWTYSLKDKLWQHISGRAEKCFIEAQEKRASIKSIEELSEYSEKMRKDFIDSIGGIPYDKKLPLNAKTVGIIEEEGLKIEKVIFEARPSVYVTANLYIPENRKNPCGAVLFQVGHAESGKSCGQYQRVARAIASCGLIVLVMDPVGQGERLSYFEEKLGRATVPATVADHQYAGEQCVLTGDCISRYFIADAMRAIDYLESREEVDSERIGATGSSGGGTATCHLMLCDPRIKAAAPGTFVTTRRAYMYVGGSQDSEQIWPGATEHGFDHHEFILCFAPKPVMLLVVESDFFPIEGTEEVLAVGKRFYKLFDKADNLIMVTDKSTHAYTDNMAEEAAIFFARELNGEVKTPDATLIKSLPNNELWCTEKGQVSLAFPDAKFVYQENLERYKELAAPKVSIKDFLVEKINKNRQKNPLRLRSYGSVTERDINAEVYMWFPQPEMPNWGMLFSRFDKTPTEVVICLWGKGTDSIEEHIYTIRNLCKEGKAVFVADLSGMGKCTPHSMIAAYKPKEQYGIINKLGKDLFFLGDSLCALRLFELQYLADVVCKELGLKPSLYAEDVCAAYARLYKEIDNSIEISLYNEMPEYNELVEEKYYEDYNITSVLIPEIARYYK